MTEIVNVRKMRTRPHQIEAVLWPGAAINATPVINWVLAHDGTARYHDDTDVMGEHIAVETFHSTTAALPGDYIVKDEHDQFDVVDPISLNAIYEEIPA